MKFKTFLALVITGGLVLSAVVIGSCVWLLRQPARQDVVSRPVVSQPPVLPAPTTTGSLRPVDRDLLEALRRPVTSDRIKDAFPGRPYKIALYCDNPGGGWNRAKIDLNRNNRWDEKITIVNGEPTKRQVASRDDESYDLEYRWRGGQWVAK
ncbi:hypothetical protein [Chloracidobacterium thermophilum]|uniref:hypothetical protein n=1 Tax=Chloracidobacterium thermophilum TaxID=458033 RepID=UPI00073882B8|nr:hypothetical protein [Chloracidobacterium thermophilum]